MSTSQPAPLARPEFRFRLGVLDFCVVSDGISPKDAIEHTLVLAARAESLGYTRYWLAEHHTPQVAHAAPEYLVPRVAAITSHIRVGTGGVLLRFHSPLKLAKGFTLLHTMFPGRIDLGVGRGRVEEPTASLLLEHRSDEVSYEKKLYNLIRYLHALAPDSSPAVEEDNQADAAIEGPELWTLGTQETSMKLAAQYGTAFCLSLFVAQTGMQAPDIAREYRERFTPSPALLAPRLAIAVAGACADTEAEARRIAQSAGLPVLPSVVGTPDQCLAALTALRDQYQPGEIIVLDLGRRLEERLCSYSLLAEALQLR